MLFSYIQALFSRWSNHHDLTLCTQHSPRVLNTDRSFNSSPALIKKVKHSLTFFIGAIDGTCLLQSFASRSLLAQTLFSRWSNHHDLTLCTQHSPRVLNTDRSFNSSPALIKKVKHSLTFFIGAIDGT